MPDPTTTPPPPPTPITIPPTVVNPMPYMIMMMVSMLVYLGGAVAFQITGNTSLAGICVAAIPVTITSIIGMKTSAESKASAKDAVASSLVAATQSKETHVLFNSRMTELMELKGELLQAKISAALAQGELLGRNKAKGEIEAKDSADAAIEGARAEGALQGAPNGPRPILSAAPAAPVDPVPVKVVAAVPVPVHEAGPGSQKPTGT